MKKNILKFLIPAASLGVVAMPLVAASCSSTKKETPPVQNSVENNTSSQKITDELNTAIGLKSNVWNSFSADKVAQSLQTYRHAKLLFDKMVSQDSISISHVTVTNDAVSITAPEASKYIPVVFMDLDETVLDNFKLQNYFASKNINYDYTSWSNFVKAGISSEVPGSIDFIKYVWSKGGVVMFNSNRKMSEHKAGSFKNLKELGLEEKYMPDWIWWMKGVDVKNPQPWTTTNGNYNKETRMNTVSNTTFSINGVEGIRFRVIMKIGDDISDFNDSFTKANDVSAKDVIRAINDPNTGYGQLFGNSDIANKSVTYDSKTKTWNKQDWSASYVFVPGNQVYGSWIELVNGDKNINYEEAKTLINSYIWNPDSKR
ncbi:HAD family acid phosphatase [Metamycoplasma neophronis]|uniref:5'-nucleotidase, lipoprotein e(P4) family n=1 Tax=Metamycoplasma neophronis TaxID=872983 RepID=A0ABY2Z5U8_9BACT|nr:HAD family acid phosphatase [Metamycoplasma neophronis]TPR54669.1 hypothetical protein FJR74_00135 [Metamycoplasma neophronis]